MDVVRSLPATVFWIIVAFPVAMAGVVIYAGLHARRVAAAIRSTATVRLSSAADGWVSLEGTAEPIEQPLRAPLTGAECCWFHAKVEELVHSTSSSREATWRTVRESTSLSPFLLRDGSTTCAIDPHGAEVTPTDRSSWYGAAVEPEERNPARVGPGEAVERVVRWAGTSERRFRYFEERIYPGDRLFALGELGSSIAGDEEEEDPDEIDEGAEEIVEADEADANPWERSDPWYDLGEKAREKTKSWLRAPPARGRPYVLSTTPREKLLEMTTLGGKGAFAIAVLPLALAVGLVWIRFQ